MDRTFKVVSKGLKGEKETPIIVLKNDHGDKLSLNLTDKSELDDYEIGQILSVKVVKEQQTLA